MAGNQRRGETAPTASILLVEDEVGVARPVISRLGKEGHRVRWVESIREARAAISDEPPELLLLDVTLETDGLDFFQALRTQDREPPGGVVVLAAESDARSRERAHQLGASAVVTKPVRLETMATVVRDLAGCL